MAAVSFLDIMIVNNLLHTSSFHPPALIKALPYSQMLRVKRITSESEELGDSPSSMADRFRERGYIREMVDQAISKVNTNVQREDTIQEKKVFVTKYTTASRFIKHIVQKHWHHLQTDANLGPLCQATPMFAYKRGKKSKGCISES
ncbi:hypothetical protein XELAEV_18009416mg [Xenopus laevis]|uniref:Helix-turn-helix domain-containing protein n=1 Tax=Xenopus laevis TaxID=8355 RepID=A0A974I0Q7_XENLA|nr:hypothetical protein XELAEV_18009416mg [Xenopus laevis]